MRLTLQGDPFFPITVNLNLSVQAQHAETVTRSLLLSPALQASCHFKVCSLSEINSALRCTIFPGTGHNEICSLANEQKTSNSNYFDRMRKQN